MNDLRRVPHIKRPDVSGAVHVTMRLRRGLPSLRRRRTYARVEQALRKGGAKVGFRIYQFSVMSNHLHLIVDADRRESLARGMQGLAIRIAKSLNRLWRRVGSVFADRYFARWVRTPMKVRRAVLYVLQNARKHGIPLPRRVPDPFSSAPWFDGWAEDLPPPPGARPTFDPIGYDCRMWDHFGPMSLDEVPGAVSFRGI